MNSYTISFTFRGRHIVATVHQYSTFYLVYFTDADIINSFGGQLHFNAEKENVAGPRPYPKDSVDLFRAIAKSLR